MGISVLNETRACTDANNSFPSLVIFLGCVCVFMGHDMKVSWETPLWYTIKNISLISVTSVFLLSPPYLPFQEHGRLIITFDTSVPSLNAVEIAWIVNYSFVTGYKRQQEPEGRWLACIQGLLKALLFLCFCCRGRRQAVMSSCWVQ